MGNRFCISLQYGVEKNSIAPVLKLSDTDKSKNLDIYVMVNNC